MTPQEIGHDLVKKYILIFKKFVESTEKMLLFLVQRKSAQVSG
jgi:hypothetical protein